MSNERSLNWCLVLYPSEDDTHKKALDYIISHYSYAYIVHNRDILDDGSLKKEHTHIVIKFNNYRWRNAIADELGITPNYLEKCRNLENALKYLIHFNNEDKAQYDISEVHGDLSLKLINYLDNTEKSESDKVLELLDFINNIDGFLTYNTFVKYVCSIGLFDIYRRSALTFIKLIDEHNKNI